MPKKKSTKAEDVVEEIVEEEIEEETGVASSKEEAVKPDENESAITEGLAIKSLQVGRVVVSDAPSGKRYDFPRAGAVLPLESEDYEFMKGKVKVTGGCCGNPRKEKKQFEILD